MEFLNQLVAGFIQNFKMQNPRIFTLIVMVLALVYLGLEMAISGGVFAGNELTVRIIQFIDIAFMAAFGSKTAPYLKEYLNQVSAQQVDSNDSWWTSLIDSFKMKSPMAFGITATVLITFFVGSQYAIHFGIIPDGNLKLIMQIVGYADIVVLMLLGARTGQYLIDNPPGKDTMSAQSVKDAVLYYD